MADAEERINVLVRIRNLADTGKKKLLGKKKGPGKRGVKKKLVRRKGNVSKPKKRPVSKSRGSQYVGVVGGHKKKRAGRAR